MLLSELVIKNPGEYAQDSDARVCGGGERYRVDGAMHKTTNQLNNVKRRHCTVGNTLTFTLSCTYSLLAKLITNPISFYLSRKVIRKDEDFWIRKGLSHQCS